MRARCFVCVDDEFVHAFFYRGFIVNSNFCCFVVQTNAILLVLFLMETKSNAVEMQYKENECWSGVKTPPKEEKTPWL